MMDEKFLDEMSFQRNLIQLISAELVDVNFKNFENVKEGKKKLAFQILSKANVNDNKANIYATAIIGSEEDTGFKMSITYKGIVVSNNTDITGEKLKEYTSRHIIPMLLPYIRETSTSLISRTNHAKFILPTLDVLNHLQELTNNE